MKKKNLFKKVANSYFGLTAIAVSPSIVSGRVVDTMISSQLLVTLILNVVLVPIDKQ